MKHNPKNNSLTSFIFNLVLEVIILSSSKSSAPLSLRQSVSILRFFDLGLFVCFLIAKPNS